MVGVAQWLEHQLVELNVAGSSPVAHPKKLGFRHINMTERLSLSQNHLELFLKEQELPFDVKIAMPSDIGQLIPLINEAYRYENEGPMAFKNPENLRVDEDSLRKAMEDGFVIGATRKEEDEERILGCVQYKEIPPSEGSGSEQDTNAYFGMLAVNVDLQKQHIGTRMAGLAESIAAFRNRRILEIQVINHSAHLLRWYPKLGYEEFGRKDWNAPFLTKPTKFVLMKKKIPTDKLS